MAKQLWIGSGRATTNRGTNDAGLAGSAMIWSAYKLIEVRGNSSSPLQVICNSVTGPTNGIEAGIGSAGSGYEWISEPLSADFTVSGTITLNLWAAETTMNDNIAVNAQIFKLDGATGTITQVAKTARVTEVALTTAAVNNFTVTPTSTAFKRGDRILVRIFADDAGTMAAGGGMQFYFNCVSAAINGDSWIQFTENLTFEGGTSAGGGADLYETVNTTGFGNVAATTMIAQSFYAPGSTLHEIRPWLQKTGTPTDNCILEIRADSAGSPSSTVLATLVNVAGSSLPTTAIQSVFSNLGITGLTPGALYWIVFRRSGALDNANSYFSRTGSSISAQPGWGSYKSWTGSAWSQTSNSIGMGIQSSPVSAYYLTDTAETINPGSAIEKKALTIRGSGTVNAVTNTAAGPTNPIQITNNAGGTVIEWYTPPLNAFSLGGRASFFTRAGDGQTSSNAGMRAEIAIVNGDGSGAVVWGVAGYDTEPNLTLFGTDVLTRNHVSGDDTAVSTGQRLRFRLFIDDMAGNLMAAGKTVSVSYNGPTVGVGGDCYVMLPVVVTEQSLTTPVTQTLAISYGIAGKLVKTLAISYNVKAQLADSQFLSYNIKTVTAKTQSLSYNVRKVVTDTLSLTYGVAGKVPVKSQAFSYNVKKIVAKTLAPSYNVKQQVPDAQSFSYTVRKAIVQTATTSYIVRRQIAKTLAPTYNIKTVLADSQSFSYVIRKVVAKTQSFSYNVKAITSKTLTPSYIVKQTVTKTVTSSYNIVTVVVLDDFNRGDSSTLGSNWTAPLAGTDPSPTIVFNTAHSSTINVEHSAYWNVDLFPGNHNVSLTLTQGYSGSSSQNGAFFFGLSCTAFGAAFTGYIIDVHFASNSSHDTVITIYRGNGGSYASIGVSSIFSWAANDKFFAERIGSTINVYQNGTLKLTVSDPSPVANGGRIGFGLYSADLSVVVDNFDGASVAATSVTKTITPSYNIIGRVAKTLSTSYLVKRQVPDAQAFNYVIRKQVSNTLPLTYSVRAFVTKTSTASYTVRKAIVKTLAPSYNVIGRITKTLAPTYNVKQQIVQTKALTYNILSLGAVSKQLSIAYNVRKQLADSQSFSYFVRTVVPVKTLSTSYTVRKAIVKTVAPSYTVRQQIIKALSPSYIVKTAIVKTLAPSYIVKRQVPDSQTFSYTIISVSGVIKNLSVSYLVRKQVPDTLSVSYIVKQAAVKTLAPSYNVKRQLPDSQAFSYVIRKIVVKTATFSYTVTKANVTKTFTASYLIRTKATNTLTVTYTVKKIVTRIRLYGYNIRQQIAKPLTLTYGVRQQTVKSLSLVYSIGSATVSPSGKLTIVAGATGYTTVTINGHTSTEIQPAIGTTTSNGIRSSLTVVGKAT